MENIGSKKWWKKGLVATIIIILLVPFLFATIAISQQVTLIWDPNSEPDLAGYKLYYRTSGWTYNVPTPLEDEVPIYGPSPITLYVVNCNNNDPCIDNTQPTFTLEMDLSNKDYWMVLTAFDNEVPELESGFSNEVNTTVLNNPPPPSGGGSGSGGGGGGGGGGCFIKSLHY